jgi:CBS domain-containing protein
MDIELQFATETIEQAGPVEPLLVSPDASLRSVLRTMRAYLAGSALVTREGRLIGIFTERDALRLMARGCDLEAPIERYMVADPVSIRPGATIAQAILRMSSGGYRRLPIVDSQGRATGIVQVAGIVHYLAQLFPKTVYTLPPEAEPALHEREGP